MAGSPTVAKGLHRKKSAPSLRGQDTAPSLPDPIPPRPGIRITRCFTKMDDVGAFPAPPNPKTMRETKYWQCFSLQKKYDFFYKKYFFAIFRGFFGSSRQRISGFGRSRMCSSLSREGREGGSRGPHIDSGGGDVPTRPTMSPGHHSINAPAMHRHAPAPRAIAPVL